MTVCCRVFWDGADYGDEEFVTLMLLACPRIGERLWFRCVDMDGTHDFNVEILEVQHGVEVGLDPFIQLYVRDVGCDHVRRDDKTTSKKFLSYLSRTAKRCKMCRATCTHKVVM